MFSRLYNRLFMKIIRRRNNNCVHVISAVKRIQICLHIASQFFSNCLSVLRIKDSHDLRPFFFLHNPSKFRSKITCSYNCISYRVHSVTSYYSHILSLINYFTDPSVIPPAILFCISIKKMTDGTTTSVEAAIISPQFSISAP